MPPEPADDYALLDAGDGRRLERFGSRLVDRPAPSAEAPRRDHAAWRAVDLRYEREGGWSGHGEPWHIALRGLTLELRPTAAGQLGLFPEHAAAWPWLAERLPSTRGRDPVPALDVLHLFAYTGATTLALARAGASVAHVDASRPAVAWARRNAQLSGLAAAPVRWLVDDAAAFVAREVRRGRRYRGLVLDPPSYGHGRGGRAWRLEADLPALLDASAALLAPGGFVLLTSHSMGWDADRLADALEGAMGGAAEAGDLQLPAASGAMLHLGAFARVIID